MPFTFTSVRFCLYSTFNKWHWQIVHKWSHIQTSIWRQPKQVWFTAWLLRWLLRIQHSGVMILSKAKAYFSTQSPISSKWTAAELGQREPGYQQSLILSSQWTKRSGFAGDGVQLFMAFFIWFALSLSLLTPSVFSFYPDTSLILTDGQIWISIKHVNKMPLMNLTFHHLHFVELVQQK